LHLTAAAEGQQDWRLGLIWNDKLTHRRKICINRSGLTRKARRAPSLALLPHCCLADFFCTLYNRRAFSAFMVRLFVGAGRWLRRILKRQERGELGKCGTEKDCLIAGFETFADAFNRRRDSYCWR
jgi:hypothetical protein